MRVPSRLPFLKGLPREVSVLAGIAFFADTAQPAAVLGAVASLVASFAYASQQRHNSRARVPAEHVAASPAVGGVRGRSPPDNPFA